VPTRPPAAPAELVRERAQPRAALALRLGGDGVRGAVRVPGRGRVGKDVHLRHPEPLDERERPLERGVVLGGEADDHVGRQVEAASGASRRSNCDAVYRRPIARRTPSSPDCSGTWRCGETVGVSRSARDELVVDVVDLDRREPEALDAGQRARLADEARRACSRPRGRGSSRG
jgi:hypothetical protein